MKFDTGNIFVLTTESINNEDRNDNENEDYLNRSNDESELEIKHSSKVPKENQIKLKKDNQEIIFEFSTKVQDDELIFTLSEIDALAPFVYTKSLTLKDMIKAHHTFSNCSNLNQVKEHMDRLFKNKMIKLSQKNIEEINLEIKAYDISYTIEFAIVTERKMVKNKDQMLLKLYEIQKQNKKILDGILSSIKSCEKKTGDDLSKLVAEIKDIY